jgi:CRP/FNR family cyclic AMP-dependent transcriptional regulator
MGDPVACLSEPMDGVDGDLALSRWVWRQGRAFDVRCNALLFAQGNPCDELFWVERGWVKLVRTEGTGTDIIIGFRQAGALLGAWASMAHTVHPLSARARTAVRVWRLSVSALHDALDSDPRLRRAVLRRVGLEALEQIARCGALGCLGAREHLERVLVGFVSDRAVASITGSVRVPLTTGEIAGLLGIDLSHACRLLRAMKHEGLIEISRGWIVIPDPSRLDQRHRSQG